MLNANPFKKASGSFSCRKMNLTPLLLLVLLLAGCGGLLETQRPADVRYWLEPLAENASAPLDGLELALELTVVPGLDSERVLVLEPNARLGQVGQARWADSLPDVLQSVIARSLANQGAELNAGERGRRCRLNVEVQEFFARGAPPSAVQASLAAQLDCDEAAESFRLQAAVASGSDQASVIAALQESLNRVTRDLLKRLEPSMSPDFDD
jgi:cholesterol transport system auxiliary component